MIESFFRPPSTEGVAKRNFKAEAKRISSVIHHRLGVYATVPRPFTNLRGPRSWISKAGVAAPAPRHVLLMICYHAARVLSLWSPCKRNKAVPRCWLAGWLVVQFVTEFSYLAEIALGEKMVPVSRRARPPPPFQLSSPVSTAPSLFWNNYRFIGRFMRPRPECRHWKFSGRRANNCNIVYKDNEGIIVRALVFARARRVHGDTPVICHWPFTDFGQIRGDSGRDAGNLLQLFPVKLISKRFFFTLPSLSSFCHFALFVEWM